MSDIFDQKLVPSGDAIASAVGDETVILELKNGAYFGLDAIGTRVWELLKEGRTPAAIRDQMVSEYDVASDVLEGDIRRLLGELKANAIVVEAGPSDG